MKRPAIVVLVLTLFAVVAASLWVPCRELSPLGPKVEGDLIWHWIGDLASDPRFSERHPLGDLAEHWAIDFSIWGWSMLGIITIGGLLSVALHVREKKRTSLRGDSS